MISVVIATFDSATALGTTLGVLVPGAMRGVIREVIVADGGSTDATIAIADAAGCNVLASAAPLGGRLAAAAGAARGRWLLFLRPGTILEANWLDEIVRFTTTSEASGGDGPAAFRRPGARTYSLAEAVLSFSRSAVFARPHPEQGLLIGAGRYKALGGHRAAAPDPEAELLARIGRRGITILQSAAWR